MLEPNSRQIYLEELRPPAGYVMDRAVATTFSLDLLTLLMAPLSMALQECRAREEALQDPIAVLEALRQTTDRLVVFCQQDRIAVPSKDALLFRYLEPVVVGVRAPNESGVFHPKTWLMRFISDAPELPVVYRFLCLSRNLTFDRSWDTALTLEGALEDRERAFARNRPLADFLASLSPMATTPLSPKALEHIELMADEVLRVRFEPPEEFEDIHFFPLGIRGYTRRPSVAEGSRLLVMSPFVSDEIVGLLAESGEENILISRAESLDGLDDKTVQRVAENTSLFFMDDAAERPEAEDVGEDEEGPAPAPAPAAAQPLHDFSGLHAKLYIVEDGWYATVLTGSANATTAGLEGHNVEFLVQLKGMRSRIGIEKFLGGDEDALSFRKMLRSYDRSASKPSDLVRKKLEQMLDAARRALAETGLSVIVSEGAAGLFNMSLRAGKPLEWPGLGVQGTCFPISLQRTEAREVAPLANGQELTFAGVSAPAITGFFAFNLNATYKGQEATVGFVLNLPTTGMPADRDKRVLQEIIRDSGRFIRYLLLILAEENEFFAPAELGGQHGKASGEAWETPHVIPLLEELVRAYSRHPEKIGRIARLVEDLRQTEDGRRLLPPGFEQVWDAFMAARTQGGNP
jgi:hypothetical protein